MDGSFKVVVSEEGAELVAKAIDGVSQAITDASTKTSAYKKQMADTRAEAQQANELRRVKDALDPLGAAQRRVAEQTEVLVRAFNRGALSAAEFGRHMDLAKAKANSAGTSIASSAGSLLKETLALAGAYVGFNQFVEAADSFANIENKINSVSKSTREATEVYNELFKTANQTRSGFEETAKTYQRMKIATNELGVSDRDVIGATKALNEVVKLSGSSSLEASQGVYNFVHALSQGKLDGREFRAIMKEIPLLGDLIAQKLGVSHAELYKMAKTGKITAEVLFDALKDSGAAIDESFNKTIPTASQSIELFHNEVLKFFKTLEENFKVLEKFSSFFSGLTNLLKAWTGKPEKGSFLDTFTDNLVGVNKPTTNKTVKQIGVDIRNTQGVGDLNQDSEELRRSKEAGVDALSSIAANRGVGEEVTPLVDPGVLQNILNKAEAGRKLFLQHESKSALGQALLKNYGLDRYQDQPDFYALSGGTSSPLDKTSEKVPAGPTDEQLKAAEKFEKQWERIRDAIDPVGSAERKVAKDTEVLQEAFSRGLYKDKGGREAFDHDLERVQERYRDALDPMAAMKKELDEETKAFGYNKEMRQSLLEVDRRAKQLHKEGHEATGEEREDLLKTIEHIRELKTAEEEKNKEIEKGIELMKKSTPLDQYNEKIKAINEAVSAGKGNERQAAEARRDAQHDLQKSTGSLSYIGELKDALGGDKHSLNHMLAQETVAAVGRVSDALVEMAMTGKLSFASLATSIVADIARMITEALLFKAISSSLGLGSSVGGAVGASASSSIASSVVTDSLEQAVTAAPMFLASGGSFMVGGNGGIDTTPVSLMLTRGERLTVENQQQQKARAEASSGYQPVVNVKTIIVHDAKAAALEAMNSEEGERVVIKHAHKNRNR